MNRMVHIDTYGGYPSPFSGRVPAGFDCRIDIAYETTTGETWKTDPAATLVLTGRTTSRSTSYPVPATDIVNGKAMTVIPGGDLSDPNGYDATLVGTVNGVTTVIASGVFKLSGGGAPEIPQADVIDDVPLLLTRGQDAQIDINLWVDSGKTVGYDLTGSSVTATIYESAGGAPLQAFAVTQLDQDSVRLSMYAAQVDTLPVTSWWTLMISGGGGTTTLAQGTVTTPIVPPS